MTGVASPATGFITRAAASTGSVIWRRSLDAEVEAFCVGECELRPGESVVSRILRDTGPGGKGVGVDPWAVGRTGWSCGLRPAAAVVADGRVSVASGGVGIRGLADALLSVSPVREGKREEFI